VAAKKKSFLPTFLNRTADCNFKQKVERLF
jgi:hypothetical protein